MNGLVGIVGGEIIHLTGYKSSKLYPEDLRLDKCYDAENDKIISFITNNFDLGPLEWRTPAGIAGLMRRSNGSKET